MMAHEKYMQNEYQKTPVKSTQTDPSPGKEQGSKAMAGGFFIGLATLLGFFIGAFNGQVSAGAIIGFTIGIAIAIAIWLYDIKKQPK